MDYRFFNNIRLYKKTRDIDLYMKQKSVHVTSSFKSYVNDCLNASGDGFSG